MYLCSRRKKNNGDNIERQKKRLIKNGKERIKQKCAGDKNNVVERIDNKGLKRNKTDTLKISNQ